jgi:hypothetical protein
MVVRGNSVCVCLCVCCSKREASANRAVSTIQVWCYRGNSVYVCLCVCVTRKGKRMLIVWFPPFMYGATGATMCVCGFVCVLLDKRSECQSCGSHHSGMVLPGQQCVCACVRVCACVCVCVRLSGGAECCGVLCAMPAIVSWAVVWCGCVVVLCSVVSWLCRVVSCRGTRRVVSCHVVSCRVVSCRVVSHRIVSCCQQTHEHAHAHNLHHVACHHDVS